MHKKEQRQRSFGIFIMLHIAAALSACSNVPMKPEMPTASQALHQAHLKSIANIQQFSVQGRIGVQTDNKGFSGGLNWQHSSNNDEVALYSPFGGQVASISKTAEIITLKDANGKSLSAPDAEILTHKALGWRLPLKGLSDWTLGRPSPAPVLKSTWDDQGLLATLVQDGWNIEYQNYEEHQGHLLPNKIILKSPKVNLKLLIEKWDNIAD